ncbi:MAG: hypothetical protein ACYDCL_18025 [Myxococcales bacterium]
MVSSQTYPATLSQTWVTTLVGTLALTVGGPHTLLVTIAGNDGTSSGFCVALDWWRPVSTAGATPPVLAGSAVRTGHLFCQPSGPAMTPIPGLSVTLNLPTPALVQMAATGDQRMNSSPATGYQVGYGFVVDGTVQGNSIWGTHIQSSPADSVHDGWALVSSAILPAGPHTIVTGAAANSPAANGCVVCDESGSGGSATVEAYDECAMNVIATPLY